MIDFHVHPWTRDFITKNKPVSEAVRFFRANKLPEDINDFLEEMDAAGIDMSVLLGQDVSYTNSKAFINYTITNEYLKKVVDKFPKRFVAFAGIDPNGGIEGLKKLKSAVEEMGFIGLKIHPSVNSVYINDERIGILCEYCQEKQIPVLFHTGTTALGNCQIKYSKPEYVDELAVHFPELKIVMAHFGWPWHEVALAVALRHKNVYMDVSGWKPKYIPEIVIRYMDGILSDRFLFGTDYPMISQVEWLKEFEEHVKPKLRKETLTKLLDDNARKLLRF